MLYFGYGSNLSERDLAGYAAERGSAPIRLERIGPAFLPDRRLAFTHRSTSRGGGVLDVPPARGNAVAGVLFRPPSRESLAALDLKEADGHTYRRFATVALTDDGAEWPVFSYEVLPERRERFVTPADGYLDVVRHGYEAHGLATGTLDAAGKGETPASPVLGVFVYGTLREGEERHHVLSRHAVADKLSATTPGTLLHLGAYPGLVLDEKKAPVAGEFYIVPFAEALYGELDAIEGFLGYGDPGSLYRRVIVRVRTAERGSMLAYTYIYAGPRNGSRVIGSGDWRQRGSM